MKTSIFRVIAFLSILLLLSNIYFFGKVLNLREKIENLNLNDRKDVFFGNSLTAIPATNADFSFSEGYFASINDTILLDQYLNLGLFGNVEYNEFPTKFLYEFNYNDSSFLLIDKKYNFENTDFEYIVYDTVSRLLFFETKYPFNDSLVTFTSVLEIRTRNSRGDLSLPIEQEKKNYCLTDLFLQDN
jgi:hypothetical protein